MTNARKAELRKEARYQGEGGTMTILGGEVLELLTPPKEKLSTKEDLDKRDRRLLHAIRKAAENALDRASHGHNDGWQPLRDALDEAEDEMGAIEDFEL